MIDFTNCKEEINTYKGSEKKKTLIYENKKTKETTEYRYNVLKEVYEKLGG